jgi:hypothetical protein
MLVNGITPYPLLASPPWREFHAAFNRHCQKFYSSEFISHNCCKEYNDCVQNIADSDADCEDEEDALGELVGLVKSLSAKIEKLEADRACFSYEDAEDIPVLETDVLGIPTYDEEVISDTGQEQTTCDEYPNEDDEEQSSPMVPVYYDCESDPWESHEGEKEEPNAQFISCSEPVNEQISPGTSQPVYDSYESDSELNMKDFQEHAT